MGTTAIDTFSTFGVGIVCIVLAIMALAIFFKLLSRLGQRGAKPESLAVRGVLKNNTWASVHMQGGKTFERVRFIGFTNAENIKTHLPYDLNGMVILEDAEGSRYLVRAKAVQMIVIAHPASEKSVLPDDL